MGLANITYNEIINAVKTYIKTYCFNIANYAGIDACFKAGYSVTSQIAGNATAQTYYKSNITRPVNAVNANVVDTDMNNFISSLNLTDKLNNNVSANNFFSFINNMLSFCSTKLAFATSQYSSQKYLIYYTGNTNYSSIKPIEEEIAYRMAYANDVHDMLNLFFNVVNQNIRNVPCLYSITFS